MVFLGRDISEQRDYSEKIAELIDEELREIIDHARDRARTILRRNRDQLDLLATTLMTRETLEGDGLRAILAWQLGDAVPEAPPQPPPEPAATGRAERTERRRRAARAADASEAGPRLGRQLQPLPVGR